MKRILASLMLVLAFAGTAMAADGLYWESKTTSGQMPPRKSKSYAASKKFKTIDENVTAIMRLDKEVLWTLRDKEKKYTEMTFADMEQAGKQAGAMIEQMESQIASLPPEQRERMKKMMESRVPSAAAAKNTPIEVKNTGEKKTISGFACTKYVIDPKGSGNTVVWATKDVKGFDAIREEWESFRKRMMAMMPGGSKDLGAAFAKIDGFPIQTEMQGMTTIVTKVEKRAIANSEFDVPAGYVKEKNPMLDSMKGMGGMGKSAPK